MRLFNHTELVPCFAIMVHNDQDESDEEGEMPSPPALAWRFGPTSTATEGRWLTLPGAPFGATCAQCCTHLHHMRGLYTIMAEGYRSIHSLRVAPPASRRITEVAPPASTLVACQKHASGFSLQVCQLNRCLLYRTIDCAILYLTHVLCVLQHSPIVIAPHMRVSFVAQGWEDVADLRDAAEACDAEGCIAPCVCKLLAVAVGADNDKVESLSAIQMLLASISCDDPFDQDGHDPEMHFAAHMGDLAIAATDSLGDPDLDAELRAGIVRNSPPRWDDPHIFPRFV